jgi:hypothetical protein
MDINGIVEAIFKSEETRAKLTAEGSTIEDFNAAFEARLAEVREAAQNDGDYVESIRAAEKAKQLGTIENALRQQFGLTKEEMEGKKFKDVVALAKSKIQAGRDESVNELQARFDALQEKYDTDLPAAREEGIKQVKDLYIKNAVLGAVAKHADKLAVPQDVAMDVVSARLAPYALDFDLETNQPTILDSKGVKPVIGDRTAGLEDVVTSILDSSQLVKKSGGTGAGAGGGTVINTQELSGNAKAMAARIAGLEKQGLAGGPARN